METAPLFFSLKEWHEANMVIGYVQENLKAVLWHEHAASMRLQIEETLGTFNGFFFVTLYLNEAVQRVSFGYITCSSSFNDVCMRLHILEASSLMPNMEHNHQTTSTSTHSSCQEGFATLGTVIAPFSVLNWLSPRKSWLLLLLQPMLETKFILLDRLIP